MDANIDVEMGYILSGIITLFHIRQLYNRARIFFVMKAKRI